MTSAARSVAAVLSMWVCVAACGALDVTPGGPTPPGVGTPPDGTRCVLFGGNDVLDRDPHATPWGWLGTTWSSLPSDYAPSPRSDLGSAVLGTSIVFFGGWPHETISDLQETWVWTAGEWTQANPTSSPSARANPTMATLGGVAVLFGGGTVSQDMPQMVFQDTWEWDGTNWNQRLPAHSPPARYFASMATLGNRVVLFGGSSGEQCPLHTLNDTFVWDGTDWSDVAPAVAPSARQGAVMVAQGDGLILFGGCVANSSCTCDYLADTWRWDGSAWTQVNPVHSPPARELAQGAALDGNVILYGGSGGTAGVEMNFTDTWVFDGTDWTNVDTDGPPGPAVAGTLNCF